MASLSHRLPPWVRLLVPACEHADNRSSTQRRLAQQGVCTSTHGGYSHSGGLRLPGLAEQPCRHQRTAKEFALLSEHHTSCPAPNMHKPLRPPRPVQGAQEEEGRRVPAGLGHALPPARLRTSKRARASSQPRLSRTIDVRSGCSWSLCSAYGHALTRLSKTT